MIQPYIPFTEFVNEDPMLNCSSRIIKPFEPFVVPPVVVPPDPDPEPEPQPQPEPEPEQYILNLELIEEQCMHRLCGAFMSPQNTLVGAAFTMNTGLTSMETDIQITSDGVPVLFHDLDVGGLTAGFGIVGDTRPQTIATHTLAEVKKLDAGIKWGDGRYVGTQIPTLEEFFKFTQGKLKYFYPELKEYRTADDIKTVIDIIVNYKMEDITSVASFRFSDMEYIRNVLKNEKIGLLYTHNDPSDLDIANAVALGGKVQFSISYTAVLARPAMIKTIRDLGSDLICWTVPTMREAAKLRAIGITRFLSDRPLI